MHDSTTERLTGQIELRVALAGEGDAAARPVTRCVSTWVRAIEIGCFGLARVRVVAIEVQGPEVRADLICERLPAGAVDGLARMLRYLSATLSGPERFALTHNGRSVAPRSEVNLPGLPDLVPFAIEFPADLTRFVRVEIEFHDVLAPGARDAVFDALATWDVLVAAFGDEQHWSGRADLETRLLSPRIVEHQVDGYFASFECLHLVVLFCVRLHQRLAIERLTLE